MKIFEKGWKQLQEKIVQDEEARKQSNEACSLCGFEALNYEPVTYYCNGPNCNMQRIRRNSYYFTGGSNQYHWCAQCYKDLKSNEPIPMGDSILQKSDLVKKKNDETHAEPWVQCDNCKRWNHQICALFNGRQNTHEHSAYYCPSCILLQRRKTNQLGPTARKLGGKDLPHTPFSEFIEKRVMERLEQAYAEEGRAKGGSAADRALNITIRQVSSQKVGHMVKPNFLKRYRSKGFPEEFPARSKCLLLFQELDGVDVLLFGMYVYEYGHTCPQPNQRRVYISYLDSVFYFRPRKYRTMVYKEVSPLFSLILLR